MKIIPKFLENNSRFIDVKIAFLKQIYVDFLVFSLSILVFVTD